MVQCNINLLAGTVRNNSFLQEGCLPSSSSYCTKKCTVYNSILFYCRRVAFPLHLHSSSTWTLFSPRSLGLFCNINLRILVWREHVRFRIFVAIACQNIKKNQQMLNFRQKFFAKFMFLVNFHESFSEYMCETRGKTRGSFVVLIFELFLRKFFATM